MSGLICRLRGHRWVRWARVDFGPNAEATPYPEVRFCERCLRVQANVTAALIWHFSAWPDGTPLLAPADTETPAAVNPDETVVER